MKTKSRTFTSAVALCAAAAFSFTAVGTAHARLRIVAPPSPYITPGTGNDETRIIPQDPPQPLPPMPAPVDSGTFIGTVME